MKKSSAELSTGIFIIVGFATIVWFSVQAGARLPAPGSTYPLNARFTNVTGLKKGSQVFLSGVPVGRVEQIHLDRQYAAIVQLQLNKELQVPTDTMASIRTNGLLGDKFIALSPGSDSENLRPGATITDTEPAVDLESLISRFAFGSVGSPSPSASPQPAQ